MTLANKYRMPIAAIKNIVGYQGITNRPLPAPLSEDQIQERQEKRGEFLVKVYHRQYANDISWELNKKERENEQA